MILLAEHDEPSLAAKKKQRHVALKTATSTPKNRVWGFENYPPGRISNEPDLSAETATGSVQFSYETASGQTNYYTRDHLGSVREMLNSSGTIVARYQYDPYGRTTLVSGTNMATFQYAGYYLHQASGLELAVYRTYDPITGRWLSRDPIAESGGLDLYSYVADNPIIGQDSLGLEWHERKIPIYQSLWQMNATTEYNVTLGGKCYHYLFQHHMDKLKQFYAVQRWDDGAFSTGMGWTGLGFGVAGFYPPAAIPAGVGGLATGAAGLAATPKDPTMTIEWEWIPGTFHHYTRTFVTKLADCPCEKAGISTDLKHSYSTSESKLP